MLAEALEACWLRLSKPKIKNIHLFFNNHKSKQGKFVTLNFNFLRNRKTTYLEMKKVKNTAAFIAIILLSMNVISQTEIEEELSLESGTIENQFDYMIEKSNKYQDYKVIKKTWLYTLKSSVSDSLNQVHNKLSVTEQTVTAQNDEIESLESRLKEINNSLSAVEVEKNSIDFFGNKIDKPTYKGIMWSIIGGLLACLLFFIFKFFRSNVITRETKKVLSETQDNFEAYKKRSLEREQKIKRELQDQLNKHS